MFTLVLYRPLFLARNNVIIWHSTCVPDYAAVHPL